MMAARIAQSVLIMMRLDSQGFDCWQGQEIYVFSKMSRLALWLARSPVHCVPGVRQLERKVDNLFSPSAEIKNGWSVLLLPCMCS